jgi:SAM-dependent methyltransferase
MIKGLAPGTILQFVFLRSRLKKIYVPGQNFIEVGSGNGHLSNLLLSFGLTGYGVDLNGSACENNAVLNADYIAKGKYRISNSNFTDQVDGNFDFLISSMVIEHIADNELKLFLEHAKKAIKPTGKLIFLVPSNMDAWGIEDEIAGHVKRYSFESIDELARQNNLKVDYKCGLNYPISNWILKLSNRIVSKNESHMRTKSELEKTVYTGNRNVKYKTVFPRYFNLILNEFAMLPFHWLQLLFANNGKSLVMYFELTLKK